MLYLQNKTSLSTRHSLSANQMLPGMAPATRLANTATLVYLGVNLDRIPSYKTHICNTKQKVNAWNNIIRKLEMGKQTSTLFYCRIRMCCVGKINTWKQTEPCSTRLLPNHNRLPETYQHRQPTPAGWHSSSGYQADCS